jgi:hypothetical protein
VRRPGGWAWGVSNFANLARVLGCAHFACMGKLHSAFSSFVVLGGAVVAAMLLYWLAIPVLGFDSRDVFQGGLLTAAMVGAAYLAGSVPRFR